LRLSNTASAVPQEPAPRTAMGGRKLVKA